MNKEDKIRQSYENYKLSANKNPNIDVISFNKYKAVWDQLTTDRRLGKSRSHESIPEQIKYRMEFNVSRSVGRRRFNIIKEKDSTLTLYKVKRMSSEEYNNKLKELGIDVSQLYEDLLKKNMNSGMSKRDAAKSAGNTISHDIYGSKTL